MSRAGIDSTFRVWLARGAALVGVAAGVACSLGQREGGRETAGSGGASGAGAAPSGGQGGDLGFVPGGGTGGGAGGMATCAAEAHEAKRLPLDMYLMLDQSGSMRGTKWDSVTSAITSFVSQPGLGDMAVGMQFFPIMKGPGPCTDCNSDMDCGSAGPCAKPFTGLTGKCNDCDPGGDSCVSSDYGAPAVEIAPLPGVLDSLVTTIKGHMPLGGTPTSAALQGALDYGRTWATAHPDHVTIVVLATDGEPNECDTQQADLNAIAAAAANASPRVLTFGIGVFAPYDVTDGSAASLDQIAMAGGTGHATVVDTTQDINKEFLSALNAIRDATLPCTYDIPAPAVGQPDYSRLNVQYTPGGGGASAILDHFADRAHCPATGGGWYYDDPQRPTRILLCDATCTTVSADHAGKIDILLGCKTQEPA